MTVKGNQDMSEQDNSNSGKKRGRPSTGRSERITVSFTPDELKQVIIAAASAPEGPVDLKDWVRNTLLFAAKISQPKEV